MKGSPATRKASTEAWGIVDHLLKEGRYNVAQLGQVLGYKSTGGFAAALQAKGLLAEHRRVALQRLVGNVPNVAPSWGEFTTAAGMTREQLSAIVGDTPTEILHPRVSKWLECLREMAELQFNA